MREQPFVIGVIVGSSRPGRRAPVVAGWAIEVMAQHPAVRDGEATVALIDLARHHLPLLDEPVPARFGDYRNEHTRAWSATVAACDAFVFVSPEYNRSVPAVLKNGIDYLDAEWRGKPAGLLSYGVRGAERVTGHLRDILTEVGMEVLRESVELALFTDFDWTGEDPSDPTATGRIAPGEDRAAAVRAMVTDLLDAARDVAAVA
ncbi:NADPH-dependent FMN reductase [Micromonospora endophytica]|uniref:NADPH-dependent FMN reductase n=1 Tax=Micromonospora endophytica TaxID=515350 RepID=A0A2W2D470_9ACTN|nr:NADPH-dependent FMN reductase [Micromonospora endophytica]PZG00395.1 NADPH-dependent FMN reductase [Micromonospora endophytica]RIW40685.1 NAD(P)H-dependent oxidoreductase [Micromonospora endophytica]BCJ57323.1 FMN reductase [Micromonospora endophytica]